MPSQHARLSPSASKRWLTCPASVRVADSLPPQPESSYAHEGTLAHALGEIEAGVAYGLIDDKTFLKQHRAWLKDCKDAKLTSEQIEDMKHHIADYVALIGERMAEFPGSQLMLEQRLDTGVPTCWGTADVVIISPSHVEIIDLKYGVGIPVSAVRNPQLRLYACGAMDMFGDILGETELIRATVFQPRLNSTSTEEIAPKDLRAWREAYVLPIAERALGDDAEFGPSEDGCRWCPASGQCAAQLKWATTRDFDRAPDLLTPEEIAEALEQAPFIRQWLEKLSETSLRLAYSEGTTIPGHKVVLSGGTRVISDVDSAIKTLVGLGFSKEELLADPKLRGLGDLEKLLKRLPKVKKPGGRIATYQKLDDVLNEDQLGRTPGKPALVPDSDPRAAINPNAEAAKEFAAE